MKLIEALRIIGEKQNPELPTLRVRVVCGFTPMHFQTFLQAHLRRSRPDHRVEITSGIYGDIWGTIGKLNEEDTDIAVVILEWSDLDARLGLRGLGSWSPTALPGILKNVQLRASELRASIGRIANSVPVAVCFPTLPLPPFSFVPGWQGSSLSLEIRATMASMGLDVSRIRNVKVLDTQRLDMLSPLAERFDPKTEVFSGFPYEVAHASILAELLTRLTALPTPKKGLITDLDDTLWSGILGEVGLHGVNWDLEHNSHMHGAYQRLLHAFSESGILIGVASKNDPEFVTQALLRDDLILPGRSLFPVEASWGPKSEAVERILRAWNISADDVVFVDDSPMELAEVQARHAGIETKLFPKNDYQALNELLYSLRDLFGKSSISEEDSLRRDSIRRAHEGTPQSSGKSLEVFLEQAEAEFSFDFSKYPVDDRAVELINKTNQFNLNGRRISEAGWQNFLKQQDTFLLVTTYRDKYGPLGKISVIAGREHGKTIVIENWVMSCRAFSRRIEHRSIEELVRRFGADEVTLDFEATPKNGPLREFLADLLDSPPSSTCTVSRNRINEFLSNCLPKVTEVAHG